MRDRIVREYPAVNGNTGRHGPCLVQGGLKNFPGFSRSVLPLRLVADVEHLEGCVPRRSYGTGVFQRSGTTGCNDGGDDGSAGMGVLADQRSEPS